MDRYEFVAWLQIAGFINHPTNYTTWLKKKQDGSFIKLWITDKYTAIRFIEKTSNEYGIASFHYTFENARGYIVGLITGGHHD